MRFLQSRVAPQVELLVDRLIKEQHIAIEPESRDDLCKQISKLIYRYIEQVDALEERVQKFLIENDLDEDSYRYRIRKNMADESNLPILDAAFDYLNAQLEAILWENEDVEDIFVDTRQLVALVTPHLKMMAA